ncbi:glycosyltransferase [Streptomyces sp. ISL-12]|uniref:glycosyltransferase n=1 Tax=Streptomyces sp. ISL-12 TaxID=2819177 RepID=UPI001BE528C0|nr:glycosyltransferase [Streptomyces sp. ISL-12]MBT2410410.1 glycosyltransferase [Streptomyces sp. ISL-12]
MSNTAAGTGSWRRAALVLAVALTAAAVAQQFLLVAGGGGLLPGWQPWPFLLGAAPAWWAARARWSRTETPRALALAVRLLRRVPGPAYAAGVLLTAGAVWAVLQDHEPYLGHEEAVYANKARSWADGTPAAGWGPYRPVGLPALGRPALAVHDSVGALRAVALLLTLFTLAVTCLVAARWTTPRRGALVALLVLGGLGFLRRTPEFLNDIGATGLLLLVVALLVRCQERPRSRWTPLATALVALAAFYLRYGSLGNLLAIALAALFAYGPRAWLARGRRLALAAGVFAAGLLPHFVHAERVTGSPLGLILWATSQANRSYVGDGLVYYAAVFPYRLAGDLGAVIMTGGLLLAVSALRGRCGEGDLLAARRVFLGTTAVLVFVVLGLVTDGEPRFVYLPVVLLTLLGVEALPRGTGRWGAPLLAATGALAALTVLGTTQVVAHGAMPGPTAQARSTVPVAERLAADRPCLLVTGYEPEAGWYSGCDAVTYAQYRRLTPPPGTTVRLLWFTHGRLQPDPAALPPGHRTTIPTGGPLGTATVITLPPER